jgi:hypothetical protein
LSKGVRLVGIVHRLGDDSNVSVSVKGEIQQELEPLIRQLKVGDDFTNITVNPKSQAIADYHCSSSLSEMASLTIDVVFGKG